MTGSSNAAQLLDSSSPQRLLAVGGILLILVGIIFGDIFAAFILHPNNDNIGAEMYLAAEAVADARPEDVGPHFAAIGGYLENRGTKVDAHNHIVQFGFLALMLALLQPLIAFSGATRKRLAQLFLCGAIILPPSVFLIHYVGLAYSPLTSIGWASILADFGGMLVILACALELLGLWRGFRKNDQQSPRTFADLGNRESRLLLCGGVLLLLVGYLFGAWYAATDFERLAATEGHVLTSILAQAAAGDMVSVGNSFTDYGTMLAEKGIKIAAHAHLNEVGMMALLLAFVQPLVFLSDRWKRIWVIAILIGFAGLPISILMELQWGLLAGGMADISGLIIITALIGMLFGVLRQSGRQDFEQGKLQ